MCFFNLFKLGFHLISPERHQIKWCSMRFVVYMSSEIIKKVLYNTICRKHYVNLKDSCKSCLHKLSICFALCWPRIELYFHHHANLKRIC